MHLLVGLGNPGKQYAGNRHNIGFLAVEEIARHWALTGAGAKFHALCAKGRIGEHEVVAILPQTFMNRSGVAVGEAARFYKIPPSKILVLHDELDLENGRLKVKLGGGDGGHNGIKDIDRALGPDYWRARIGIGHPGMREQVTSHVLSDFEAEEWAAQQRLIALIAEHSPTLLDGGAETFMNAVALGAKP